jgi:hypothetical protein
MPSSSFRPIIFFSLCICWFTSARAEPADEPIIPSSRLPSEADYEAAPFILSSESLGTALGGAGLIKSAGQPQASVVALGFYSSNNSWATYLGLNHYQLQPLPQWLFSAESYRGNYKNSYYYFDLENGNSSPGSNDSDIDDKMLTRGEETFHRLYLEYVIPVGDGKQGAQKSLFSRPSAGKGYNPLENGITSIKISPYHETRYLPEYSDLQRSDTSSGIKFLLEWDNRNSSNNSTYGTDTNINIKRDWGTQDRPSWTTWEFDQSLYLPLGSNSIMRQQVLAMNFYLADTPTWDRNAGDISATGYHRPPEFAGVKLGGFKRLRGYSGSRYYGRSAIVYSAEYRMQPLWQPLQEWPLFNLYEVPWWQWVAFAEAGRVADEFDFNTLHEDMKWSSGLGARFQIEGVVVRAELAFSADSSQFWVMVNQPF